MAAKTKTNAWFRAFHGLTSDDKWPLIARKSGQNVAVVVAVWTALLECASQAEERGSVEDFDPESIDVLFGLEDGACESVLAALSSGKHPRIVSGRIVSWDKRQPKREREDDDSTDRVRKHREEKKNSENKDVAQGSQAGVTDDVTPCNANETPSNAPVTPSNAHIREEERREEFKTPFQPARGLPTEKGAIAFAKAEVDASRLQMLHADAEHAARLWFNETDGRDWVDRNGMPVKNWKSTLKAWLLRYAENLKNQHGQGQRKPARGSNPAETGVGGGKPTTQLPRL